MLVTVVSSFIFSNKTSLTQSLPESVRELWVEWELRAMVLISLSVQIVLLLLGNRRKYISQIWIRGTLWVAYNSASWFATVSLGVLSKESYDSKDSSLNPHYVMTAFWAPFLLVHLGGPDTITAYALEDNELWTRDFPGLFVQFFVAVFVLVRSWTGTSLNYLAIPILVSGLIKYGERIWALRYASRDHFKDSLLPRPDPGPNYAKFMGEYTFNQSHGYIITLQRLNVSDAPAPPPAPAPQGDHEINNLDDASILNRGYYFFKTFRRLFADLILSFQDRENSMSFFRSILFSDAFRVIEVELGFMFDVLYTKACIVQTSLGSFLRFISLSCISSVFITFSIIDRNTYSGVDVVVTYVLLVGAISLELYSLLIVLISSDWTKNWLSKHNISNIPEPRYLLPSPKKWSNSIAQYNLISFCLNEKPTKFGSIQKCFCIYETLEKWRYEGKQAVSTDLKQMIFEHLKEKSMSALDISVCKELCAFRGDEALKKMNCFDDLGWSVEFEFDQSILLWHIATDLCYYTDKQNNPLSFETPGCKISKSLSEYMLYLLVICPFMLPNGIGLIRFQDTCAEATEFFQEHKNISGRELACRMLLQVNTDILPIDVKGDRSKSVLFDACRLAASIQLMRNDDEKWKMISHVWVEMLCYAANRCLGNYHAKQLGNGGELLTHVWLLMAHLGITENFQISRGHVRAKLVLS